VNCVRFSKSLFEAVIVAEISSEESEQICRLIFDSSVSPEPWLPVLWYRVGAARFSAIAIMRYIDACTERRWNFPSAAAVTFHPASSVRCAQLRALPEQNCH
jgi:hypothetical protein